MNLPSSKICTKCKEDKPLEAYHKKKGGKYGLTSFCKECKKKSYPGKTAEYSRNWYLQRTFGITLEEYNQRLAAQEYRCAICKNHYEEIIMHVDHDHTTNEIRGILCVRCNALLGMARDDTAVLAGAIGYLLKRPNPVLFSDQVAYAFTIASHQHAGHKRKDGSAYITHPLRVMLDVESEEEQVVALLHDTVEDTDMTLMHLRELGFSREIVEAVDALTRRLGESYMDMIERVRVNTIARKVKIADLMHNLEDQSALDPDEATFLRERYTKALERLK